MSKPGRMLSPAMTRAQKTAAELLYLSSNRSIHYVRAEIGKIFRRDPPSYRSVRDHLRDNGYLRSKSDAAIVSPSGKMSQERLTLAMSELASGSSVTAAASKVGVNRSTVHRWRRIFGSQEEEKR